MAQLPPLSQAATLSQTDPPAEAVGLRATPVISVAEAAKVNPRMRLRRGWRSRAAECLGAEYKESPLLTCAGEVSCRVQAVRCLAGVPASPPGPAVAGPQVGPPPSSSPGISRFVFADEVWRCEHTCV